MIITTKIKQQLKSGSLTKDSIMKIKRVMIVLFFISLAIRTYGIGFDYTDSGSWEGSYPSYSIFDRDYETYGCLQAGETLGWIEYPFNSKKQLVSLRVVGDVPDKTYIYLSFENRNGRKNIILGSFLNSFKGEAIVNLQKYVICTDRIFLNIEGKDADLAKIYEVELIAVDPVPRSIRSEISIVSPEVKMPFYYNDSFLCDGVISTVWNTKFLGQDNNCEIDQCAGLPDINNLKEIQKEYSEIKSTRGKERIFSDFITETKLRIDNKNEITDFAVYLNNNTSGNISFELYEDGVNKFNNTFSLNNKCGWFNLGLDRNVKSEYMILKVSGNYIRPVVIGELEVWGKGIEEEGDWVEIYKNCSGTDSILINLGNEDVDLFNYRYIDILLKNQKDNSEDFSDNCGNCEEPEVRINGRKLYMPEKDLNGGLVRYSYVLENDYLTKDINLLDCTAGENMIILGAVLGNKKTGNKYCYDNFKGDEKYSRVLNNPLLAREAEIVCYTKSNFDLVFNQDLSLSYIEKRKLIGDAGYVFKRIVFEEPVVIKDIEIEGEKGYYGICLIGSEINSDNHIDLNSDSLITDDIGKKTGVIGTVSESAEKIIVNGIEAEKMGNIFWVPGTDLLYNECFNRKIKAEGIFTNNDRRALDIKEFLPEDSGEGLVLDNRKKIIFTRDNNFIVSGNIRAGYRKVRVNGMDARISARFFRKEIKLVIGMNKVYVRAESVVEEQPDALRYFLVYRFPETISIRIDNPVSGSVLSKSLTKIEGNVCGSVFLSCINVDSKEALVSGNRFLGEASLLRWENRIEVTAEDIFKNQTKYEYKLYLDNTPPDIELVSPCNGKITSDSILWVTGKVADRTPVSVFVNNKAVENDGVLFSTEILLEEGVNSINICSRDSAGNVSYLDPLIVTLDTIPPENIKVTTEKRGWLNNPKPILEFSAIDRGSGLAGYKLSINGGPFIDKTSPFQTPVLSEGKNILSIKALDKAGNESIRDYPVYIDTIPPDTPLSFRAVSGNNNGVLEWSEDDDETVEYLIRTNEPEENLIRVDRGAGKDLGSDGMVYFNLNLQEKFKFIHQLDNGKEYFFTINAVDRAGNISNSGTVSLIPGQSLSAFNKEEGCLAEFENVKLVLGKESFNEEIKAVRIAEAESQDMVDLSEFKIVSPIFDFSVITGEGEHKEHLELNDKFICRLDYYPEAIPEGLPEQMLKVFYFEPFWGKWMFIPGSVVDTENNRIIFSTDHFTSFSIQSVPTEEISAPELASMEFAPFSTETKHEDMTVSPSGGGVTTSMTEFVLPGRNGLDLEIRRIYDTGTAIADSAGFSANFNLNAGDVLGGLETAEKLLQGAVTEVSETLRDSIIDFLINSGDYAFSLGQGWRLNFPYIKRNFSTVLVRTWTGHFFDINSMDVTDIELKSFGLKRTIRFENHEIEHFTLVLEQDLSPLKKDTFNEILEGDDLIPVPVWFTTGGKLIEKNGVVTVFDEMGRIKEKKDPNGNSIDFIYKDLVLEYIKDSCGREVHFEYTSLADIFCLPIIEKIYIKDDPQKREVNYKYELRNKYLYNLPLLSSSVDIGGRNYRYNYDRRFLMSGDLGLKINGVSAIVTFLSGGTLSKALESINFSDMTVYGGAQCSWVFPINYMQGFAISEQRILYKDQVLVEKDVEPADYFLGIVPTAIDFNAGIRERFTAGKLTMRNLLSGRVKEEAWTHRFKYAGDDQFVCTNSSMDDGRIKIDYDFQIRECWRPSWSDFNNYIDELLNNNFLTRKPRYKEYASLPEELRIYEKGKRGCFEKKKYIWNTDIIEPKSIIIERSEDVGSKSEFLYDDWGNYIDISYEEYVPGRIIRNRTVSYYDNCSEKGDLIKDLEGFKTESFIQDCPINKDIHDRRLSSLTVNHIPEFNKKKSETKYIQRQWSYDECGNEVKYGIYRDDIGKWSVYEKLNNEKGELIKKTTPEGHVRTVERDFDNQEKYYKEIITDFDVSQGNGEKYDTVSEKFIDKITGKVIYDINPEGYVSCFKFDEYGRLVEKVEPDLDDLTDWNPGHSPSPLCRDNNPVTKIDYNDLLRKITVTFPIGRKIDYYYDDVGNILNIIKFNRYPVLETIKTEYFYNKYGELVKVIEPNGCEILIERDFLGRIIKEKYPYKNGEYSIVKIDYKDEINSRIIINPLGNRIIQKMDLEGRMLSLEIPNIQYEDELCAEKWYDGMGNIVGEKDFEDRWTYYQNNSIDKVKVIKKSKDWFFREGISYQVEPLIEYEYNADGYKISEIKYQNELPVETLFKVNGLGKEIEIIKKITVRDFDENNKENKKEIKIAFSYDKSGYLVEKEESGEISYSYKRDPLGNVIEERNPDGGITKYELDPEGRVISVTEPRGMCGNYDNSDFTTRYFYDDMGSNIKTVFPSDAVLEQEKVNVNEYDKSGNLIKEIDSGGVEKRYRYDLMNRLIFERTIGKTDSIKNGTDMRIFYNYDSAGNLIEQTNSNGFVERCIYDSTGRLRIKRDNMGSEEIYTYDRIGNIISVKDSRSFIKELDYNSFNQVIREKYPEGPVVEKRYDELGNTTFIDYGRGIKRFLDYDEAGNIVSEKLSNEHSVAYVYDNTGKLERKKDSRGTIFTYIYTKEGRIKKIIAVNGDITNFKEFCYDEAGVPIKENFNGVIHYYNGSEDQYSPNPAGLINQDTMDVDGFLNRLNYSFDEGGRLTDISLNSGEKISCSYNSIGLIDTIDEVLNGNIRYDSSGNILEYRMINGFVRLNAIDKKNRIKNINYTQSGETVKNLSYSYDMEDNILTKNRDCYSYDGNNRIVSALLSGQEAAEEKMYTDNLRIMSCLYDPLGNQKMSYLEEFEEEVFDWAAGNIGVDLGINLTVKKIIFKADIENSKRFKKENIEIFTSMHNNHDEWKKTETFSISHNIKDKEVVFTLNKPVLARYIKLHTHFNEMKENGNSTNIDASVTIKSKDCFKMVFLTSGRNERYGYDDTGNRKERIRFGNSSGINKYSYYENSNRLKYDDEYAYVYDLNGNLIAKGNIYNLSDKKVDITKKGKYTEYKYDLFNNLIEVRKYDPLLDELVKICEYKYDCNGYRVLKKSANKNIYYHYNIDGLLMEKITIQKRLSDSSDWDSEDLDWNNKSFNDFIYMNNMHIAEIENGEKYFYGTDALGTTIIKTDVNGKVVWEGAVTPFAEQENTSGLNERVRFTGKELDEDTGLYYFNARWYDPDTGRFITEDPLEDGLNWYAYCGNNPLRFVDPSGLEYLDMVNPSFQQSAKGSFPSGNLLSEKGCKLQTITNVINTFRDMQGLEAVSLDSVNKYAAENDHYVNEESIYEKSMIDLVEKLSGYKLSRVDRVLGKSGVLQSAENYDSSDEQFIGILRTDWTGTDEVGDGHTLNLTGFENGDILIQDTSRLDRQNYSDLRGDVGEELSRLDTYNFTFMGSSGSIISSNNILDILEKRNR